MSDEVLSTELGTIKVYALLFGPLSGILNKHKLTEWKHYVEEMNSVESTLYTVAEVK